MEPSIPLLHPSTSFASRTPKTGIRISLASRAKVTYKRDLQTYKRDPQKRPRNRMSLARREFEYTRRKPSEYIQVSIQGDLQESPTKETY